MLDERWNDEVEEIGAALRKLLAVESSPARLRAAEASADGRDRALEANLAAFGLDELQGSPELFTRIGYELGRALACTPYVESAPILAILGQSHIAWGSPQGLVPASLSRIAV